MLTEFWIERLKERDGYQDQEVNGLPLSKLHGKMWTRFKWLRLGTKVGFCESCNEFSSSISIGKFLDQLSDCWLLKKDRFQSIELV